MKKTLLLLLLTITLNTFSQTDSTKVPFVSYWDMGDSYNFKITKIEQQWREGKLTKDNKHEYLANFTVIDSTATSYTIKWSYENDFKNTYKIPEKLIDRFSKYKVTEIIYKTSEVGDIIEILNWKEVGQTMRNMFNDIVEVVGQDNASVREELKAFILPFQEIYSSKEGVEQIVLKELQYFHFPLGVEFDIAEPLLYEDELPNMFGGDPIRAQSKLYFEEVDFNESFCIMKQEVSLNPEDTHQIILELLKRANLQETELNKILSTAILEINDRNTFEYYFYPGIPHRIEAVRESLIDINNEKGKKIDTTIIELVYYED